MSQRESECACRKHSPMQSSSSSAVPVRTSSSTESLNLEYLLAEPSTPPTDGPTPRAINGKKLVPLDGSKWVQVLTRGKLILHNTHTTTNLAYVVLSVRGLSTDRALYCVAGVLDDTEYEGMLKLKHHKSKHLGKRLSRKETVCTTKMCQDDLAWDETLMLCVISPYHTIPLARSHSLDTISTCPQQSDLSLLIEVWSVHRLFADGMRVILFCQTYPYLPQNCSAK